VGNLRRNWAELSFEKKLSIVVVPLLLAVISAGLPILLSGGGDDGAMQGGETTDGPRSNLEVIDLAVTSGAPRGKPEAIQKLDITVRNAGELVSVVKRLGLRIRASGLLRICQAGGGLEASEAYKVELPPRPAPGELVQTKLSQQIPPGEADRFTIGLDVPDPARQLGDRLYRLDVLIYHDTGGRPVPAGTALVAAPYLPNDDYFWSGQINPKSDRWGEPGKGLWKCFDDNEATLKRMLALGGERSPELSLGLLRRD
jgi:hypothetical protein